MRKDFLEDILGNEGGDSEMDPRNMEEPEAVFVDSGEEEPYTTSVEPELEEESFIPKRKPQVRVEMPKQPLPNPVIADSVVYVQARRVAELKFGFYKLIALMIPINIFFFCMAYFQIHPVGKFWFLWPLGVSAFLVCFQYLRAFLLKGRNLHSVVEGTIHSMAMRESRRKSYRDFL